MTLNKMHIEKLKEIDDLAYQIYRKEKYLRGKQISEEEWKHIQTIANAVNEIGKALTHLKIPED